MPAGIPKKRKLADVEGSSSRDHGRVDPVYGQRSAFPGLDDEPDDGQHLDDTSVEAIAYLRGVRLEAQAIPSLLCAPVETAVDDIDIFTATHEGGFYADGAYIATSGFLPDPSAQGRNPESKYGPDVEDGDSEGDTTDAPGALIDAREAYHDSLLSRFATHRASRHSHNPSSHGTSSPGLDPSTHPTRINHSISAMHESAKWARILQTTIPRSTQVAAMSQQTVLWLLERIPSMLKRTKWAAEQGQGGKILGTWIWALLGQLGDLGTLSSDEVSIVRELGKRAGSIIVGMELMRDEDPDMEDETEEQDGEGGGSASETVARASEQEAAVLEAAEAERDRERDTQDDHIDAVDLPEYIDNSTESQISVDRAKTRLLASYGLSSVAQSSDTITTVAESPRDVAIAAKTAQEQSLMATLDMILTIVGECYGQRDLLIARDHLWEMSVRVRPE